MVTQVSSVMIVCSSVMMSSPSRLPIMGLRTRPARRVRKPFDASFLGYQVTMMNRAALLGSTPAQIIMCMQGNCSLIVMAVLAGDQAEPAAAPT